MLMNFILTVAGVALANLITIGLVYAVMLNKKVLKWFTMKYYKLSMELMKDITDMHLDSEEEES